MLNTISTAAYELDKWLKMRVGQLYTQILGAGLVLGIIASAHNLTQAFASTTDIAGSLASGAFQVALLINQLAQLHEYRSARRERRAARRARKAAAKSGKPD